MTPMITRDIHDYVGRDWDAARAAKDRYWAARIRRLGPGEGLRVADELRRQVLAQQPGWPSSTERSADLAAHVRLAELLQRAGHLCSR